MTSNKNTAQPPTKCLVFTAQPPIKCLVFTAPPPPYEVLGFEVLLLLAHLIADSQHLGSVCHFTLGGGGGSKTGKFMKQKKPKSTLLADSWGGGGITWSSLRFDKDWQNIGSFRGFIENFRLFSNRSEAQKITCWKHYRLRNNTSKWVMIRASLRFERRLNSSINLRKSSIFYRFLNRNEP